MEGSWGGSEREVGGRGPRGKKADVMKDRPACEVTGPTASPGKGDFGWYHLGNRSGPPLLSPAVLLAMGATLLPSFLKEPCSMRQSGGCLCGVSPERSGSASPRPDRTPPSLQGGLGPWALLEMSQDCGGGAAGSGGHGRVRDGEQS